MFGVDVFECWLEIEQDGRMSRQRMVAPRFVIEQQFMALVQQAASVASPVRIKMLRWDTVWDEFEQRQKQIENSIEFTNKK